jgi:hypothetical protein
MKSIEEMAHEVVLKEYRYWSDILSTEFGQNVESIRAMLIVASNLTIASLKFQEE